LEKEEGGFEEEKEMEEEFDKEDELIERLEEE